MQLQEITATGIKQCLAIAIGHVKLTVSNVMEATGFFEKLGLRRIHKSEKSAILELWGGTHLVLVETPVFAAGSNLPFDLMVNDITLLWRTCLESGLKPSMIQTEGSDSSFILTGPDGYRITVISSHSDY